MRRFIIGLAAVLVVLLGLLVIPRFFVEQPQIVCTEEARLCPDGSYVGRTGPNCEFAACPSGQTNDWKTIQSNGIEYQYPETLVTTYIHAQEWPPRVTSATGTFTCPADTSTSSPARITREVINGRTYCMSLESEGAAGSVYSTYAFTTSKDDKLVTVSFTLRAPNCANYDDPQRVACESERASFNINDIIDRIIKSARFI